MRLLLASMLLVLGCGTGDGPVLRANSDCAGCHPTQSTAFALSRHADASGTDLFRALRNRADPSVKTFCDSCHAIHTVNDERGVGCITCHTAIGNRGTSNARLLREPDGPMRGPIDQPTASVHRSQSDGFIRSSDLCGTCHEVAGPGAFVETPYTEWRASPARMQNVTCADCHMSASPGDPRATRPIGSAAVGGPSRSLSDHGFVGPGHPRAPELLAQTAMIEVAVRGRTTEVIDVEVTVHNRNIGHALPSGARFAREVWIEVVAVDSAGVDHVVSGGTDTDGAPVPDDPQRVDLADRLTHMGMPALPLDTAPTVVNAVPAGAMRSWRYTVAGRWGATPTATLRVRLRFRRNAFALRRALGLPPDTEAPIDLATATVTVP